jgi:hypothetical protein
VLALLAKHEGLDLPRVTRAFANDVLLALSCGEGGYVLVTDNERDFARIRKVAQFEYVGRWPMPA